MQEELLTDGAPVQKNPAVRSGLVWYAALLPVLGLFFENYSVNKYLGFLIWILVLVLRPVCCYADYRILSKKGVFRDESPKAALITLLPTVYCFRRCFALRHNTAMAVICIMCLSYGILGNGFIGGMRVNDDTIFSAVKGQSVRSLKETREINENDDFSEAVERNAPGAEWSIVTDGDKRTVSVKGQLTGTDEQFTLEFVVIHDGYTYLEYKLDKVLKDGEELTGDDRKDLLKRVLAPGDNKTDAESKAQPADSVT